jgi:hypothetical protein
MLVQLLAKQEGSLVQGDMKNVPNQALQKEQDQVNEHGMIHQTFLLSLSEKDATNYRRSACWPSC